MSETEPRLENAIAVVGMAARFPLARTLGQFWDNLRHGIEAVRPIPEADLLAAGISPETLRDPSYVRAAGVLEDVDLFDAPFFGFSAREAALLDPQHRLILEVAWEALEEAGYDAERIAGPVGVYAGASANAYFLHYLFSPQEALNNPDATQFYVGNDNNYLATRTSYKLGLRGPSLTVQTACSTSLVAVHLACQSLLNGECDMALAGGVSVRVPQVGYFHRPGGILAPDGHCRAFDARAAGSVMGSGVGIVALKRIEDALADRDPIRAVILGSAVNNDGALRLGFTAPGVEGQSAAVAEALALARVEPDDIGYVEAHGSGTPLGDPIEVAALSRAYTSAGERRGSSALGSVKASIGHLDAAAGVAGLIKTVLILENREIPPSLHFSTPNPEIDFAGGGFHVNTSLRPWEAGGAPRRAGVSSFGMGGTNAHAVLEEAPPREPSGPSRAHQLLLLSAAGETALDDATRNLAAHLEAHPAEPLADVAYTLALGRKVLRHRRAVVVERGADAARVLAERDPARILEGAEDRSDRAVAFLLPGLGEHYPGMGKGLYDAEPAFREAVDRCCDILHPILGRDLREILYPAGPEGARSQAVRGEKLDFKALIGRGAAPEPAPPPDLDRTAFAQPALFVTEYALAMLWKSWGVEPAALLGYSLGEYTAACLAGVFSLEDALRVVALRAGLIERLPEGAMLAVPLAEAAVVPLLGADLSLTAVNGPEISVVGGPPEAIAALERSLAERGLATRRLRTSHAFHSKMMQPVAEELARLLAGVRLQEPEVPLLSNVTGTWIEPGEATDPAYWVRHLLEPVRLADDLATLWQDRDRVLLEVGPGGGLSSLALQHPDVGGGRVAVPSLPGAHERQGDLPFALGALGRLWLGGAQLDWAAFWEGEERNRLRLPTYPFERRRYWVEGVEGRPAQNAPTSRVGAVDPTDRSDRSDRSLGGEVATTRHSRPALPTPYSPVAGETEAALAGIWQELLGVEPVGRHDSFFDLGGHSLLASQLMTRLAARFGADIPLQALFEAPTVAGLGEVVEASAKEGSAHQEPILPVAWDGPIPLSFGQERLWFLDRLIPGNPVYHVPLTTRLRGRLRWPVLAAALNEIAARHEALRTTFSSAGDVPEQVIAPALRFDPPVADVSGLPEAVREAEAVRVLEREVVRPFDLARGPLARALLVRLAGDDHMALFNLHHIVADGWSMGILLAELGTLYAAFAEGRPSPLPPLPVQYPDYAVWQRQWLTGERLAGEVDWWRERLAGAPPVLELPLDRPRPNVLGFRGRKRQFRFEPEQLAGLPSLLRSRQVTLYMVLLAAFETLLSHLSGQKDLVVGLPVAGRGRREIEGLIGFFVNTLALRADLSGDPTAEELLAQVRQRTLEAYAHEDLPFERLVEELQPERTLAHTPIFQAALVLQNAPGGALELPGLQLETLETWIAGTQFDVTISSWETAGGGLAGYWEYNTDLFDEATIDRFSAGFALLLEAILAAPERRLSRLPWFSEEERRQVLEEHNRTATDLGQARPAHQLFEEHARQAPDRLGVVCIDLHLTYGELDRRAGLLARDLRARGVGPETRVGICLERGPEQAGAVLAVWKAGGAYVPLDPEYPAERLAFMIEDAAPLLVLALERHRHLAAPAPVLCLDGEPGLSASPTGAPLPAIVVENAAYVVYTSGSTGRPKGAVIEHRSFFNTIQAIGTRWGFERGRRVLQFASPSFDAAVADLFQALAFGGVLVYGERGHLLGPPEITRLVEEQGADAATLPPSMLALLDPGDLTGLETLVVAGEACPAPLAARWAAGRQMWNGYGPTECAVCATTASIAAIRGDGEPPAIGQPIANMRAYVLDDLMDPVPAKVPGELYLGGAGVGRGYWNRGDLTAERFVPDPYGPAGERLYRTGDRARRRGDGDGELEFLGRIDQQVKVRGVRLELGEVEAVLERHPGVAQAVALLHQDAGGESRLAAYVVTAREVSAAELREHARQHLPPTMVPAVFTALESFPLSPTGKVDRRALAARPLERQAAASYQAPGDEMERRIAEIWQEVLGLERVGTQDNFFDLGGHSLALVQVQRKIKDRLGAEIPVVELFGTPTVAAIARHLSGPPAEPEADAVEQGDERAEMRRAMRGRRRGAIEGSTPEDDE